MDDHVIFRRVLDALLREDHLGMASNGFELGDWWVAPIPAGVLRIPVEADGFQHEWRSAEPWVLVGDEKVDTLDGLLNVLAPQGDSARVSGRDSARDTGRDFGRDSGRDVEAAAGWALLRAECEGERLARRLRPDAPDHPVYPTSRARHGLTEAEILAYAPEHSPTFALKWLRCPGTTTTGTLPPWWPGGGDLIPAHPLTAERLGLVTSDGPEVLVRPTLSMRTVSLVDDPGTHLKLPLATATLGARNKRLLAPDTLADGLAMQRFLERVAAAEPRFRGRILHADESTYGHAPPSRSRNLPGNSASEAPQTRNLPGKLRDLEGGAGDAARAFMVRRYPDVPRVPVAGFDRADLLDGYLDLLIDWHVFLWLRHGVALEAHQQNIDIVPGEPLRLLYRDNDGARVHPRHGLTLADPRMVTADEGELADMFITITLHLAATAVLLSLAGQGFEVPSPARALRGRLIAARDRWGGSAVFTGRVLDADHLPIKAMLTAGTLLPKQRLGCADINKHYLRTGPNYLRAAW